MNSDRLADAARLAALSACGVMDGPPRPHLDQITSSITDLTGAAVSLVTLVDDRRQFFASHAGLEPAVAAGRGTPLSHSICQYVVMSEAPLVVDDTSTSDLLREHPAVLDLGVRAYCGVPIVSPDGQTIGSVCAIDLVPHAWTPNDVALLRAFAEAVGTELDTDARFRRLTLDLHRRLLPASLPDSDRWELAAGYRQLAVDTALGGDFYDAIVGRDGSLTLVVGDIVGHDADAAIAMGQLRAGTLALVHHGASLADLADTLDRACHSLPNVFFSAWVAVRIAPGAQRAEYLAAGAIAPLLRRADGTTRYLDDATSPPIGVPGTRRCGATELAPGDALLLCTDGLVDDRVTGLGAGLDRLAETFARTGGDALDDLPHRLIDERAAVAPRDDDIAVLICRFR